MFSICKKMQTQKTTKSVTQKNEKIWFHLFISSIFRNFRSRYIGKSTETKRNRQTNKCNQIARQIGINLTGLLYFSSSTPSFVVESSQFLAVFNLDSKLYTFLLLVRMRFWSLNALVLLLHITIAQSCGNKCWTNSPPNRYTC